MRGVKGGFANFVFRTVFTALRAFLKSGFCAAQLCIRSGIVSWMPLNSSLSNVPSYSCSLIRRPPLVLPCAGFEGVFWSWSRADEQRVGILIQVLGSFVGG